MYSSKKLTTYVIRPFVNTKGLSPSQNFSDSDRTHPIAKSSVKCLVLCANICSQHVSEYHVLQIRPTTRWNDIKTLLISHVTTHLSEAFAVDFRKHLLPKNQRCSQPLATEPPSASASSAGAAATG